MHLRKFLSLTVAAIFSITCGYGQGTWQWSGRVHPELEWHTLETDHFNIHYHSGLDSIARQGAAIAEQARPTLMEQMNLDTLPRIDVIFTSEDEIMNGYAMWTNMTFIWVDQNDVAVWLEDTKWLPQVLTHELQHIVYFNAIQSKWLPQPWHFLFAGVPGWFVEGLAEYETEKWRPYRADLSHKTHILKNEMEKMDPHHDGYSKLLYLSDRFGDSTIVDIIQYRNKLGLHRFKAGFKKKTGISVVQFNEDWRRQMNTYYYGVRAQKEAIEDLGDVLSLPVNSMQSFALAADSNRIAIAGRNDKDQYDISLFIGDRDSIEIKEDPKDTWIKNLFSGKQDSTEEEKKTGPQFKWSLEEIDYGRFHTAMDWNHDGTRLAYAKYHFGQHQSMVWDIRVAEAQSKQTGWTFAGKEDSTDHEKWNTEWVTESERATYPVWSPDGKSLVYVAHQGNVSNLYRLNWADKSSERLTGYSQDTQILTPAWRPDGNAIAFAKSGPDGNLDLMLLDLTSNKIRRLTDHPAVDYLPVWHPDGHALTYTSHAGDTPNLYTVTFSDTVSRKITDVGDAVWSQQWTPGDSTILARTLSDVDSVRLVKVDPFRHPQTNELNIRDRYIRWKTAGPKYSLPVFDLKAKTPIRQDESYRFWRHPRHFLSLAFPNLDGSGLFGMTTWTDAMGRHLLQIAGDYDWTETANSWILVSYINAQHGPLWGLNVYYNANWKFRFYDQSASGLYEKLDGVQLFTLLPFNAGNAMTANHTIAGYIALHDRTVFDILNTGENGDVVRDSSDFLDLPVPESGQESVVTLRYRWVNRRPHKNLMVLPTQGKGVDLRMDVARQALYGDFDYTRFTSDMFWNIGTGGPTSLFARIKTITMLGDPPAQEIVGFVRDPAIYFPSGLMDADVLAFPENLNPRGWDGVRLGDQTLFGTFEYRIPLIPELPLEVLGFSVGSLTGALLSDVGQVWQDGNELGDWITTFGYEVKFALQAGRSPLLYFAAGQAQTIDQWQQEAEPQTYLRMALINPF